MSQKTAIPNRQVLRTRSWIFEAVMLLMDEKPYSKISVSDIIIKAGIARQTFYRNYDDKDDVVFDHLRSTLNTEFLKIEDNKKGNHDAFVLTFNYNYLIENRTNLKKILSITDIESRIVREAREFPVSLIERYKDTLSTEDYLICRYKVCYQIIGSLRVFFDWFINDMPMPVEKVASMINAMNTPKVVKYRDIPNIEVRILKE